MPITPVADSTALVVIDLQAGILALPTSHPVDAIIANAARLAEATRSEGGGVFWIRAEAPDPANRILRRVDMPMSFGEPPADWEELPTALGIGPEDVVLGKSGFSAFTAAGFAERLSAKDTTHLLVAGIATSIGVESTVREAFDRGYRLAVASDATTDPDPRCYEHSIGVVLPKLAEIDTTAAVISALRAGPRT